MTYNSFLFFRRVFRWSFFDLFCASQRLITQPRDPANRWPLRCLASLYGNTSIAVHVRSRQWWLILFSLGVSDRAMRIPFVILVSVLALAPIAKAGEPDHLLPLDPYPGGRHARYCDQLISRFKLGSPFFAQMVVRPSFDPELVVRLHGKKEDNDFD
jgi:hypothetical protein